MKYANHNVCTDVEPHTGALTDTLPAGHAFWDKISTGQPASLQTVQDGILSGFCPSHFQASIDAVSLQLGNQAFLHWVDALQRGFGRHGIRGMREHKGYGTGSAQLPANEEVRTPMNMPAAPATADVSLQLMPKKRKKKGGATVEEPQEVAPDPGVAASVELVTAQPEASAGLPETEPVAGGEAAAGEKGKKKSRVQVALNTLRKEGVGAFRSYIEAVIGEPELLRTLVERIKRAENLREVSKEALEAVKGRMQLLDPEAAAEIRAADPGSGDRREEPARARVKANLEPKENVLFDCCLSGDIRSVRRLLKFGTRTLDVNMASENGTLMGIAAFMGYADIVMELLSKPDIDVNLAGNNGATPLFLAAQQGHVAVVKRLLAARGVNVNLMTELGNTPLCMAAMLGREEVVRLLLEEPHTRVNARKDDGATALFCAAQDNFPGIVALIIKRGADVNLPLEDGTTPLCAASRHGNVEVVRRLLQEADIQINQPTDDGVTPLCVASQFGHKKIVSMLLGKKADLNLANSTGVAPVHVASLQGHTAIVEMLLHAGAAPEATVDVPEAEKYTACMLARLAGHKGIATLLENYSRARAAPAPRVGTLSPEDKPGRQSPGMPSPEPLPLPAATVPSRSGEASPTLPAQAVGQATGTIEPVETAPPGASSPAFPDDQSRAGERQSPMESAKQELIQGILERLNNGDLDHHEGIMIMVQVRAADSIDRLCGLHNRLAGIQRHKQRARYRRTRRRGAGAGQAAMSPAIADVTYTLGQKANLDAEAVEKEIRRHLEQSYHRFVSQVVNDMEFGRSKLTSGYPGLLHASAGITGVGSCSVFFYTNERTQVIRIVGIGNHMDRGTYRLTYAAGELAGRRTLRIT